MRTALLLAILWSVRANAKVTFENPFATDVSLFYSPEGRNGREGKVLIATVPACSDYDVRTYDGHTFTWRQNLGEKKQGTINIRKNMCRHILGEKPEVTVARDCTQWQPQSRSAECTRRKVVSPKVVYKEHRAKKKDASYTTTAKHAISRRR